jgi:2-phosphoglycolate phosphatase|tara:strand:- start:1607 stop:2254 length:648 start_codon:yes stop_codon:yes gene_type:complete
MQPKNKVVLFDLDGTLINSGLSFLKIVNELKEKEGQSSVDFEIVRKYSSRGATLVLKNSFPDASEDKISSLKSEFLSKYEKIMTSNIVKYDGVDALLEHLAAKKVKWGIVTNKSAIYTMPIVEKLNWHKLTDAIICPEDLNKAKPSPEGIFRGLELLDGDPKQSYYIGDHQRDIETAHNAGVISIACTYGYHETDPISWNADHIVQKPSDIMEIV